MSHLVLPAWIAASVCLFLQSKAVELQNETFVITAYQQLQELYVDGQPHALINGQNWSLTDYIILQPTNRLIALMAVNLDNPLCGGVLASVYDASLLTNNKWKCSPFIETNWTNLGFDDSKWPNAVEYGSNGNHTSCTEQQYFGDISSNSQWIWTSDLNNDFVVYCRGYLPFCETQSPCLNNGTCLTNDEQVCDCLPQYTGTICETEMTTQFTTEETSTNYTSNAETPLTTTDDISTAYMETTDIEDTTENISTENIETTKAPGITAYLSTDIIETTDSSANIETTELLQTTEYISTQNKETTNPSETTEYSSTDNMETTEQLQTTEYFSTNSMETTQPPMTTAQLSTSNSETTVPTETTKYVSTESEETTTSNEKSTESVTSQETTVSFTAVSSSIQTNDYLPSTATTARQTSSIQTNDYLPSTATTARQTSSLQTNDYLPSTATTARQTIGSTSSAIEISRTTSQEISLTTATWSSQTDNFSNTSPVIYGECPEELYCDGPYEKPGSNIEHCSCPSGFLNLNNNCCLNQNWIIALACICAGIVIGILITIIACLIWHRPPQDNEDGLPLSDFKGVPAGNLANGTSVEVTESSVLKGSTDLPSANIAGGGDHLHDIEAQAALPVPSKQIFARPVSESHGYEQLDDVFEDEPVTKEQLRNDYIFNPLMVELQSKETFWQFRPSLTYVATDVDYSIQRPSIDESSLYNHLNGPFWRF